MRAAAGGAFFDGGASGRAAGVGAGAGLCAASVLLRCLAAGALLTRPAPWLPLPSAAGLPAFSLLVHACTTLTRQCCACLTALDPQRGAELHAHYLQTRQPGRLLHGGDVILS